MANHVYINHIKTLLKKDPTLINILCTQKRTPLEYAILSNKGADSSGTKTDTDIIHTIKLLIKHGVNINSRNIYGFRVLESAIQYSSAEVIDALIDSGANIQLTRKFTRIYPPISNNDLIGFAVN